MQRHIVWLTHWKIWNLTLLSQVIQASLVKKNTIYFDACFRSWTFHVLNLMQISSNKELRSLTSGLAQQKFNIWIRPITITFCLLLWVYWNECKTQLNCIHDRWSEVAMWLCMMKTLDWNVGTLGQSYVATLDTLDHLWWRQSRLECR